MSNLYNMFPKKQATTPASIVSFDDAAGLPVAKMKVALGPVQDLHGYANPWPAGGGKNLLPLFASGTFAIGSTGASAQIADGKIELTGTTTSSGGRTTRLSEYFTLKAGTYIISPALNSSPYVRGYLNKRSDNTVVGSYSGTAFTISEDTEVYYGIGVEGNKTYNQTLYPQVESGSTITPWVPYSNICPITGRTGATVYRTGKNLVDANTVWAAFLQPDGTFYHPLGNVYFYIPQELVGKQLTFSAYAKADAEGANLRVRAVINGTGTNGNFVNNTTGYSLTELTFTPTSTSDYIFLTNSGINGTYKEIQLELGSTATTYEPYQGSTYAVDWTTEAGTVYGGTLDAVTGKLTVDRAIETVSGWTGSVLSQNKPAIILKTGAKAGDNAQKNTELIASNVQTVSANYQYSYSVTAIALNSNGQVRLSVDGLTTKEQYNEWLTNNPVTYIYPLATPVEYQLTPQEIVLLRGVMNNVWPSEGTITEFEYYTDFVPGRISNAYIDGRSLQDDGWYLKWRELSAPVPKTDLTPIPGKDGSIDQTEVFGDVYYEDRSLFLDMKYIGEKEWETAYSELLDAIHGQKCMVQFEKDPYWYWIARLIASNYKSKEHFLSMSGTAFPYKLYVVEESVSSSVNGLVEGTAATVELAGSRMRTSPKVIVTGSVTLKWGDATKTLSAGTYYVSGLKVGKEGLTVKVWGTGTVTFKYRKGAL